MGHITPRFYGGLRDFLPYAHRERAFARVVADRTAIKDAVEAAGAPHTEVGALLVRGALVGWGYRVGEGDAIEVYPLEGHALPADSAAGRAARGRDRVGRSGTITASARPSS